MLSLVSYFVQLCALRASPADAPDSPRLLKATIAAYIAANIIANFGVEPIFSLLVITVSEALATYVLLDFLMRRTGKSERMTKTATAMFGATAVAALASTPLAQWLSANLQVENGQVTLGALPPGMVLLLLLVAVWMIAIMANILKYSMEVIMLRAVAFTISLKLLAHIVSMFAHSMISGASPT